MPDMEGRRKFQECFTEMAVFELGLIGWTRFSQEQTETEGQTWS